MPHEPGHPANGNRNGNATYIIKKTGEPYSGLVLDWGGRLVTTLTGTYEGQFSQELTAGKGGRRNGRVGQGVTPPGGGGVVPPGGGGGVTPPGGGGGVRPPGGGNITPPPDITPPPNDGGGNMGGGGGY